MSDRKILITGGLGYLGGRIADSLKRNYPETTIILGTRRKFSKIPDWAKSFQTIHLDLCNTSSIEEAVVASDTIIHLAALNEHDSFKNIESAWETNAMGTQALLSSANRAGVRRFVYFSTFHIYGNCVGTITEDSPTQSHHPYATTHRAAEDMIRFYQHYENMDTLTLRLSNGFGYPMDTKINRWTLVFNDLCRQAVTSGKIVVKSTGKQHRDFITLHDVGAVIGHFLFTIPNQWEDGLYNLGGENSLSIKEVAKIITKVYRKKYGKSIPVQIDGRDDGAINNPVCFSIDKLKKTGFRLTGNMEREIEQTFSLCEKFAA
ncbi:MAG: SDR family oxidoreductase [Nitrospinaceae bacterium]|jgi:UDP-glucose 4-epimerase|nr:SDR family oxidoreductase [Nitrospinaceae bacterium]|tara:strand:+ start:471 stop:1427 length:957 start_codon:yes stop_codon:yes gene_type:complete